MNQSRRKSLRVIIDQLVDIQARVGDIMDQEAESLKNIPENLRSQTAEDTCGCVLSGYEGLNFVIHDLNNSIKEK